MQQSLRARVRAFCERFALTVPILNAPMAGVTTPQMAAAVSQAGGLGVLAADWSSPETIEQDVRKLRALTDRPFAVHVRVRDKTVAGCYVDTPEARQTARRVARALSELAHDCGLPQDYELESLPAFDAQLQTIMDLQVPVVSVGFGGLQERYAEALEQKGIAVIAAATSLREAKVQRAAGACAVVMQGMEAGGPRLNFEREASDTLVGLMSLIGPAARATGLPVIAAGGIMTGAQMAAALMAGASAVMLGTALLRTPESAAHPAHKAMLPMLGDTSTALSATLSGRLTRLVPNALIEAMQQAQLPNAGYPCQAMAMEPILRAARTCDRDDLIEMAAGQGAPLARSAPTHEIVSEIARQCRALLAGDDSVF